MLISIFGYVIFLLFSTASKGECTEMEKRVIIFCIIGNIIIILLAWSLWLGKLKEAQAQACNAFRLVSCNTGPTCNPGCPGGWTPINPIVQTDGNFRMRICAQ